MKKYQNLFINILTGFFCICFLIISVPLASFSQQEISGNKAKENVLTIYVIRSAKPLDWQSPSALYKSYVNEVFQTLFRKEKRMLGHLFVHLDSPMLDEPLWTGISYESDKEQRDYVFKEKVGMGIMGIGMKGRMQSAEELHYQLDFYSEKKEMAFITYYISEEAVKRILEFYNTFISKTDSGFSQSEFYGGAYWPLYFNEGAGCTALGLAMMELAGVRQAEAELWKRNVKIPVELVGGRLNENTKVGVGKVKSYDDWHSGEGVKNIDYIDFTIYDPSLMYHWILDQINQSSGVRHSNYEYDYKGIIPGLTAKRETVKIDTNSPIFTDRPDTNLLLKSHYQNFD